MPMIWDSNTQAFVESEIPLTYNPQLGAWQETEGLVYNPVLGAWQKVWPEISAYVYGAANETITIARNGITVATVQTNTNGRTDEQVHLSKGTYTLTGSVSGWTETQEVDSNTDRLRAMPEDALYWYGNECVDIIGGWEFTNETHAQDVLTKGTNYMYHKANYPYSRPNIWSKQNIDLAPYNLFKAIMDSNSTGAANAAGTGYRLSLPKYPNANINGQEELGAPYAGDGLKTQSVDISGKSGMYYLRPWGASGIGGGIYTYFYAIWLEK